MKRALVLSLICIVGLAFAGFGQSLTGTWETEVCLNPQTAAFSDAIELESILTVTYTIGDWAFTSITEVDGAGWVDQDFGVTGLFGLITIDSTLSFIVLPGSFDGWITTVGLNMAGVSFGATFNLGGQVPYPFAGYNDPTARVDDLLVTLTGTAGIGTAVEGSVTLYLGDTAGGDGCDLDFLGIDIGLDFTFCDCIEVESTISFGCEGFQYIEFCADGIAIPNIPWLAFNACVTYQMQTKYITIQPVFDFGAYVCIDLYLYANDLGGSGAGSYWVYPGTSFLFDSFKLEGFGFSCDIGGVEFGALTNWHSYSHVAYRPGLLYYQPFSIWEVYWISVGADACCGGVFEFDLAVFFGDTAAGVNSNLFDMELIEADLAVNVTTQFQFTMGLDVDLEGGFTEWCLGFNVTW